MQENGSAWESVLIHSVLGAVGGLLYVGIELLWRGHSHWTMFLLGGLCFVLIGRLNETLPFGTPLFQQMVLGAALVTAAELLAGLVLNRWLGLHVWDYSAMPLNLWGQVCAPYAALWLLLAAPAVILEDYMHYWWFGGEKPRYRLW